MPSKVFGSSWYAHRHDRRSRFFLTRRRPLTDTAQLPLSTMGPPMAISHAASGDLIDLTALPEHGKATDSVTLVRANHIEVFRLTLPVGRVLQEHAAAGSITIQCLAGLVELDAHGRTQTLHPGTLVYLDDAQPHAVRAM